MTQRAKIVIAYLGDSFHGWQRQPGHRTIQGELEAALAVLTGADSITVVGAGRTDAGVHAAGQVAHADLPSPIPAAGLVRGLNGLLPRQIRVRQATPVGARFHARKSSTGKRYVYRVRWHASPYPWRQLRAAVLPETSHISQLSRIASCLQGRHDWASFTVTDPATASTVRTVHRVEIRRRRDGIDFDLRGEGFLRYQVRRMVGALLEVAGGHRDTEWLRDLLVEPRPGARIRTAPAGGLTLEHVYYRRGTWLPRDCGSA
jgi:tRNA pseudouridine38-40 synthase